MVPEKPLLSPWHRVAAGDDALLLELGGECVTFEGRAATLLLPALLPLLDGTRDLADLASALELHDTTPVHAALELLDAHGLLSSGRALDDVPAPFAQAAGLHAMLLGTAPRDERARLAATTIDVVGESTTAGEIARLVVASGVGEVARTDWRHPGSGALAIVAPAAGEMPLLAEWNRRALAARKEWLQVLPWDGAIAVVGPSFVPGDTCCHECYVRRRRSHVEYGDRYDVLDRAPVRAPSPPGLVSVVAGLAVLVALRRVLGDPLVAGAAVVLELGESVRLGVHPVPRVPRCPACSEAARTALPLPWAEAS